MSPALPTFYSNPMPSGENILSTRGLTLLGTLISVLVLVAFWSLYFSAFDSRMQGGKHSIDYAIFQQQKEIDSLRTSLRAIRRGMESNPDPGAESRQLRSIETDNIMTAGRIDGLRGRVDTINSAISEITADFEKYKDDYRDFVRTIAKGEVIESLRTKSGTVYRKATIREVTSIGMQILHSEGHKRIPYEDLPDDLQQRFQFDAEQKKSALIAEFETTRTHESQVAAANAVEAAEMEAQREINKQAARENLQNRISMRHSRISALASEINYLERSLPYESRKRVSRAPIIREEISDKRAEISILQAEVSRLESSLNR